MRHQMEGAKDSCHRSRSSEPSLRSAVTPACFTCRTSLASRPPPHPGEHAKSSRVCSAEAFLHIPHICLWFTEQVTSPACLNSCFGNNLPPARSLPLPNWGGSDHLLAAACQVLLCRRNPAVTWSAAFTGDRMNNLFVEFTPSLTFRCLTPGGSSFNNIDSAPLLSASSDKARKQRERTQYQNQGHQRWCVFHTMTFVILSLLKQYIWTCGWGLNRLQAFELSDKTYCVPPMAR